MPTFSSFTQARFGLYIHVPFCLSKCPYCDFFSVTRDQTSPEEIRRTLDALRLEIDLALGTDSSLCQRQLDTIYFGGGTPSLLAPEEIQQLIEHALSVFKATTNPGVEITIECNPRAAEIERLKGFHQAGVTRISLGVQSFDQRTLEALGRTHSSEDACHACQVIPSLGFNSWSIDLIFGAPHPTALGATGTLYDQERFYRDLDEVLVLKPPHVSVYGMTLHEGTPLFRSHKTGQVALPNDNAQRQMFLATRKKLSEAGWRHYEISNYAQPGHESRHNTLYWGMNEYLGVGPGAHSCYSGTRRSNTSELKPWIEKIEAGKYPSRPEEPPSPAALRGERIMLALRQCDGITPQHLSEWIGCNFTRTYCGEIDRLKRRGLLTCDEQNVRLTEEGILLSDTVFEEFF